MNQNWEDRLYWLSEDLGGFAGMVGGIVKGIGQTAFLPTHIRKRIEEDYIRENLIEMALTPEKDSADSFSKRFKESLLETINPNANIAKWAATIGMILDLSDGKPEHLGYLAIPMALSLLYEGFRYLKKKIKNNY